MSCVPVLPSLWLGNIKARFDVEKLRSNGITAVVNCASQHIVNKYASKPEHIKAKGFEYYTLNLRDKGDQESMDSMESMFPFAVTLVTTLLLKGHNVLVHCYAGKHRSPMVVMAVVCRLTGMNYSQCFQALTPSWKTVETYYHRSLISYLEKQALQAKQGEGVEPSNQTTPASWAMVSL